MKIYLVYQRNRIQMEYTNKINKMGIKIIQTITTIMQIILVVIKVWKTVVTGQLAIQVIKWIQLKFSPSIKIHFKHQRNLFSRQFQPMKRRAIIRIQTKVLIVYQAYLMTIFKLINKCNKSKRRRRLRNHLFKKVMI